jgi:hypothetical protein
LAIVIFLIAFMVVFGPCGVQIDSNKKKYRAYDGFFLFKIGRWRKYDSSHRLLLDQDIQNLLLGASLVRQQFRQKSYDVSIASENYKPLRILKSFSDYPSALHFLKEYEETLALEGHDRISSLRKSGVARRKTRERRRRRR